MSCLVFTSVVVALYEPERIPADLVGLKGYNVYQATLPLHFTEIPICVAHPTLRRKCPPGTIARVRGSATIVDRTLLITASCLIPAAIQHVPGYFPAGFHSLPRVFVAGVVSSPVRRVVDNPECSNFDIAIDREDVWPGVPVIISCWTHRDKKRFSFLESLEQDTPVLISGVGSGWTWDNKLMVDVHTIAFNNEGPQPACRATDPPNPFRRAVFQDGFPTFPLPRQRSQLSNTTLSRVALPNWRPANGKTGAHMSTGEASSSRVTTSQSPSNASSVSSDSDNAGGSSLPSVHDVRRAARAAAAQKLRARVVNSRKHAREATPDVLGEKKPKTDTVAQSLTVVT